MTEQNESPTGEPRPTIAELDPISDWVAAFRRAKELEKVAKAKAEEARSMLASYLGDRGAEFGTVDGSPVLRYRLVESSRFATTKFREQYPELADEFTVATSSMRMEII